MARERGILVAVDGAQAPGHVEVDRASLGCNFYAASTHKWLFSPKGVGVLFARRDSQRLLKPLVVTQGWQDETIRRLENYNTRNLPEVLGLGVALDFQRLVGPERRTRRLRELTRQLRAALGDDPRFAFKTPAGEGLSAGITTVEVLGREAREVATEHAERHRIDCRPMTHLGLNGLRISTSVFTTEDQIEVLVAALHEAATA
jgi:selenocysteine lyase/cysteine desulfurase